MMKRSFFGHRVAAAVVAARLMFGAVAVSALVAAAPASAADLMEHEAWQGFTTTADGDIVFGAITRMSRGGTAAFLMKRGSLSLAITNPDWSLSSGRKVPVRLVIDGEVFSGTGIVRGTDLIEMPDVNEDVLARFVDGAEAKLDIDAFDLVWTLDLHGFTASMADAVRVVKVSY